MTADIRVHPDLDTLCAEAARAITRRILARLGAANPAPGSAPIAARSAAPLAAPLDPPLAPPGSRSGIFTIALAGGRTPIPLYRRLAAQPGPAISWERVHFYWGDERYVPPGDPASNFRLANEELLCRVPVPAANVHPMPTLAKDPDDAAAEYESLLRREFGPQGPLFDLAILGLGAEGHTASLFPGSPALRETQRWVVSVLAPVEPARRMTLTLPALNLSREIFFLVAGAEKAPALAHALSETTSPEDCPAAGIRPVAGETTWWVDAAAAAQLAIKPGGPASGR